MSSIFSLKSSPEELKSIDGDVSNFNYNSYSATRDITGPTFSRGQIRFPFELSSTQWWLPSRSYMRMRCSLTDAAETPAQLTKDAGIGPNMNLAAGLFSSMELLLNGKVISRCSDHVSQVDTLEQRLHKSKAWMDSIGASVNWLQEIVVDRINQVSADGDADESQVGVLSWKDIGLDKAGLIQTNIVEGGENIPYKNTIKFTAVTQVIADKFTSLVKVGDSIVIDGSSYIVQATPEFAVDATALAYGKAYGGGVAEDTVETLNPTLHLNSSGENKKSRERFRNHLEAYVSLHLQVFRGYAFGQVRIGLYAPQRFGWQFPNESD